MKNILIIGCGLLGSSLIRSIHKKKIIKKILIYEKSKKNILKIKRFFPKKFTPYEIGYISKDQKKINLLNSLKW